MYRYILLSIGEPKQMPSKASGWPYNALRRSRDTYPSTTSQEAYSATWSARKGMWLKRPCFGRESHVCAVPPCLLRRMLSSRRSVKQMSSRELKVLNLALRTAELSATLEVEKCGSATNVRATSFEHAKQCAA